MHKYAMLALMAIAAFISQAGIADESTKEAKLLGTWRLVEAKYLGKESKLPSQFTTIMHVTSTHRMFMGYDDQGNITRAAGGPYVLQGNELIETPEYGFGKGLDAVLGKRRSYTWRIEGDRCYLSAKNEEETWSRVERK